MIDIFRLAFLKSGCFVKEGVASKAVWVKTLGARDISIRCEGVREKFYGQVVDTHDLGEVLDTWYFELGICAI